MALTVPKPEIKGKEVGSNCFMAEYPMDLNCGTVFFPDGSELGPEQARQFGFRLYRRLGSGVVEIWNVASGEWGPESPPPDPEPLAFQESSWQSVLVAIGQKDKAGRDKFVATNSGFPKYYIRCIFSATDTVDRQHEGTSPASTEFTLSAPGAQNRAGLATQPKEITAAEEIRLYLKDTALTSEKGTIAIRRAGGGFEIELAVSGAHVLLTTEGNIQLKPASGQVVRMDGDVSITGTLRVNGVQIAP